MSNIISLDDARRKKRESKPKRKKEKTKDEKIKDALKKHGSHSVVKQRVKKDDEATKKMDPTDDTKR